jgi:hypothetical protein
MEEVRQGSTRTSVSLRKCSAGRARRKWGGRLGWRGWEELSVKTRDEERKLERARATREIRHTRLQEDGIRKGSNRYYLPVPSGRL